MEYKLEPVNGESYFVERLYWLIKLRWVAVIGVIGTVCIVDYAINLSLPILFLYGIAGVLIAYNTFFSILISRIKKRPSINPSLINVLANTQIFLDLLCLAILIHLSGGVENPFIFYFIFHMIIAGILLTRRAAFLQATYAIFLFLLIVFLEHTGFLRHYCLESVFIHTLHDQFIYILGVSFAFISTLYIAVYMATSTSMRLREKEKSLRHANELLREKDHIKSEYVLRVTHDIKEDLSAIQSCIEPVTAEITGPLNKSQNDLLWRAKERSKKLIFYVNALLNITKIKLTKKLKMEYFSLSELVQKILENTTASAKNKHITFEARVDSSITTMKGVRIYIQETLLNLLANSLKYTPSGGKIDFKIEDRKDSLLISIKDTGIGIPKDELPHVFEEFYRAKNARSQERKGTGLGLSIAKQIVDMHSGKIWIESKEGEGTNIYLEFPKQI